MLKAKPVQLLFELFASSHQLKQKPGVNPREKRKVIFAKVIF